MRRKPTILAAGVAFMTGLVALAVPAGATSPITQPDDPKIPSCADFAPMKPAAYTSTTTYDPSNPFPPGTALNMGTPEDDFTFTINLFGDVNADVDGSTNPKCGAIVYTLSLYTYDPNTGALGQQLTTSTFASDQGASPQTSFPVKYSWCSSGCTFSGTGPANLAYWVTTTTDNHGKWVTLDRAPETTATPPYEVASLDGGPSNSFW